MNMGMQLLLPSPAVYTPDLSREELLDNTNPCVQARDKALERELQKKNQYWNDLQADTQVSMWTGAAIAGMGLLGMLVDPPKPSVSREMTGNISSFLIPIGVTLSLLMGYSYTFEMGEDPFLPAGTNEKGYAVNKNYKEETDKIWKEFYECKKREKRNEQSGPKSEFHAIEPWYIRTVRHFDETGYPVADRSVEAPHIGGFGRREDRVSVAFSVGAGVAVGGAMAVGKVVVSDLGQLILNGLRGFAPAF